MGVRYILNGQHVASGNLKVLPRIGEKMIAAFLPQTCIVVDIVHDFSHDYVVNVFLAFNIL
jgi:hypothetical protein